VRRLFLVALLLGCSSTLKYEPGSDRVAFDHGVPNLYEIQPGVYRMGQPTSPEAWQYLAKLGVKARIKLNSDDECRWCDDAGAKEAGIAVLRIPIEPRDIRSAGVVEGIEGVFKEVAPATLNRITTILDSYQQSGINVVFGCTYGQDRTGLIAMIWRYKMQHWPKRIAYQEALDRGFHPALTGLRKTWEKY
jgi:protein tyrosine/serine phosphatase